MASRLLDFHRNKPTLNPIALGEFGGSGIGVAAAWVNELDQVKALAYRSVGLYQTFYAGHFTSGILRRARSCHSGRRVAGDVGETMKVAGLTRLFGIL
jgi:hypothetical protein